MRARQRRAIAVAFGIEEERNLVLWNIMYLKPSPERGKASVQRDK